MENDYRITKLHGTLIGDNRIPDLPDGEKTKVFSSTNGKTAWVDLPDGGIPIVEAEFSEELNSFILPTEQTTNFILHEESAGYFYINCIGGGAYSGFCPLAGTNIAYSLSGSGTMITLSTPVVLNIVSGTIGSDDTITIPSEQTGPFILSLELIGNIYVETYEAATTKYYGLSYRKDDEGDKLLILNGEGTTLTAKTFPLSGDNGIETIEVSNATINHDGSYTYTLPKKPTSNPYILKTVDSGESAYYLMTGDSDVSFGMRPLALTDSLFGGNFMVVSGTTATQRPTNFPPQPKSADNGKVLTVKNGYPSWETAGGASVSPTLNLMDLDTGNVRTSITEEEKTNLDKGLYNMVYYLDESLGEGAGYSIFFPEIYIVDGMFFVYKIIANESGSLTVSSIVSYYLTVGEKDSSGNYPITIEKGNEAPLSSAGGGGSGGVGDTPIILKLSAVDFNDIKLTYTKADYDRIKKDSKVYLDFGRWYGLVTTIEAEDGGSRKYIRCAVVGDVGSIATETFISATLVPTETSNTISTDFSVTQLPYNFVFPNYNNVANVGQYLTVNSSNKLEWKSLNLDIYSKARYKHTVTLKTSAGAILWTQTLSNSKNTPVDSYQDLKTLFGGELLAGYGEYAQLDLRGGTEATDKLIKADGTEATLESLGAIVYTDVCFLPK